MKTSAPRPATLAAAIYARISLDPTGARLGVERQEDDCRTLAERKGWRVVDVYVDNDVSAYTGRTRPAYDRLLRDIADGNVTAVIAWDLDRLHRRPIELESFILLCQSRRVELATVSGDVDLSTAQGQFVARMMGAVARHESQHKAERIRGQREQHAATGRPGYGGKRPYGYARDGMTVVVEEAAIIREAVTRLLAGESLRGIAADLNRRGVPTVTGRPWGYSALRNMLSRPRLTGQRTHRGAVIGEAVWPAILTPVEGARIRHLLAERGRTLRRTSQRYLLSGGLLRCGICGGSLTGSAARTPRYACSTSHLGIGAAVLDVWVTDAALTAIDGRAVELERRQREATAEHEGQAATLATVDDARAELVELAALYAAKKFTLPEWLVLRAGISERISMAERTLSEADRSAALGGLDGAALRREWPELPLSRQRAIISTVFEHLVIEPSGRGRRFSPERVSPVGTASSTGPTWAELLGPTDGHLG